MSLFYRCTLSVDTKELGAEKHGVETSESIEID